MSRFSDIGGCRLWMRGDPEAYTLHPDNYAALLVAWTDDECFFTGRDLWDDPLTVNLRNVVAVALWTPAAIADRDDEQREQDLTGVT